jgi:hypothetical protein
MTVEGEKQFNFRHFIRIPFYSYPLRYALEIPEALEMQFDNDVCVKEFLDDFPFEKFEKLFHSNDWHDF